MIPIVKKEFVDFEKYHKNIYNIYFHIFCGFIFMTLLFLLSNKYSNILLIIYSLLLLFTIHNILITSIIFVILFIMIYFTKKYRLSTKNLFLLFLVFYFLPDVSHYLTNEPSQLNINNISIYNIVINTIYFIPFSIFCLYKKI
jgi:hypothetical protein